MKTFKNFVSLLSGLVFLNLSASAVSNVTSLEIDDEFSACNILKSKYEILKLRLEITEKFGNYVPEIDQKLIALESKVERLYQSLEHRLGLSKMQRFADVFSEEVNEISTFVPLVETTVTEDTVQNIAATTAKIYLTDFNATEEPKVCTVGADGNKVCYNLALPSSCAEPRGLTCSNNKCRIQVKDSKSFMVTCDEDWIVIQRRINGSVDFDRDWMAYKNGFGDLDGEFWLGLEKIHALTTTLAPVELLIKMTDFDGIENNAMYESFAIGSEEQNYALTTLGSYSGENGDSLAIHKDEKFTTYDADNDKNGVVNCAQSLFGGWWFYDCDPGRRNSNLNGQYYDAESASSVFRQNGIKWSTFRGNAYSLKSVQMMIRRI